MTVETSLLTFLLAASLLTMTPGVDTALVLRTAALQGPRRAVQVALGISAGCLLWGAAVALDLGALLAASELAFNLLKWIGAAYLAWLGLQMLLKPRRQFSDESATSTQARRPPARRLPASRPGDPLARPRHRLGTAGLRRRPGAGQTLTPARLRKPQT